MLDNQRLLLVSGQNLVNGAKYRLEYDPTTEVAFKTVNSYFVVRTKEGITREFGSTADSHIEATAGNTLCWLLAKTTDQSGNTITYQYEEVSGNGDFYLTKIQYVGNRSIQFAYETRSDKQTTYFAGSPINNNKILKSLSTYIGQIQVKQYQFSYEKNGLYTQLTEVVEKGQNNDHTYRFDRTKNNLSARKDNVRNLEEIFAYDNLNRLTRFASSTVEYDVKGNITRKSDVGNVFSYATPGKPYAVSRINAAKNTAIPPRNQAIAYTSFERPSTISENGYEAVFTYDGSGDRKKMQLKNNGTNQSQRYYLGGRFETEYAGSSSKQILYLGGDAYTAPAVYINQGNGWYLYFICRDYLGSITHVVNTNGTVIEENSYDAWGRLRNPATQTAYLPNEEPSLFTGRGYTGHEHLPHFGLIQMNARLYDPATGRFLSSDPFVQIPDFSQNFNRYSYCVNNPLAYVDEDGELIWMPILIAAGIGATINVATHWKEIKAAGGWKSFWKFSGYMLAGGVAGGAGGAAGMIAAVGLGGASTITAAQMAAASTGFSSGAIVGMASGATSGFILETSNSLIEGIEFGGALQNGLMGSITGGMLGGLTGGLAGGIRASANGRDFWTGKLTNRDMLQKTPGLENNIIKNTTLSETENKNTYSVYQGIDEEGKVRYVGITNRDPQLRFQEHLNSGSERSNLYFSPIRNTGHLNKIDARIMEQNLINKYGLPQKGGQLYNKINSIAPKWWELYNIDKY